MKYIKPALLIALATASAGASAQQYYPSTTNNSGEIILQQILDHVIGSRYTTNTSYRTAEQQELFRRADLNRDGYLTQAEVDAYRARMGYSRYYDNDRYDNRYARGVPVRIVDVNRDGYISRSEARNFIRDVQRQGLDDYYDRYDRRR